MNNVWGTVCTGSWGRVDAAIVCRQLGYSAQGMQMQNMYTFVGNIVLLCLPTGALAFSNAEFGRGIGPIQLESVDCSGSESNLIDCSHTSFISCSYYSGGAGVRCQGT